MITLAPQLGHGVTFAPAQIHSMAYKDRGSSVTLVLPLLDPKPLLNAGAYCQYERVAGRVAGLFRSFSIALQSTAVLTDQAPCKPQDYPTYDAAKTTGPPQANAN